LTVLATSRTPLHIRVEREYPVGPLSLPDKRAVTSLDALAQTPAVEFFIRCAEATDHAFTLTAGNAVDIAEIAIRLDGLPLAIELAAARIKVLSPAALLARLQHRLPLLVGGAQDLPARQQTLRATLDWSHALLTSNEQVLFRRLAVFAGGCTLEAAEWVSGVASQLPEERQEPPPSDGASPRRFPDTLDLLSGLVAKNLLRMHDDVAGERRFGMLETIREYGREHLAAAAEDEKVRDRHLSWCIDLAEHAAPELDGADQAWWLRRLDIEHDNLRAALAWALERRHGEPALRLSGALALFWRHRGHFDEGRSWLERALTLDGGIPPTLKATALVGMARLAYEQGRYEIVSALEEARALFRAAGDARGIASALDLLSTVLEDLGDHARAAPLRAEALAIFRALDDRPGVARLLNSQGLAAYDLGDYDRAEVLLTEALSLTRALGSRFGMARALNNLALVAQERRDIDRAEMLQAEALFLYQGLGIEEGIADCLENFAMFTSARGQLERSTRLFAAAAALRARIGSQGRPSDLAVNERIIAAARIECGEAAFLAAWAEGETMSLDAAIALALGEEVGTAMGNVLGDKHESGCAQRA
jgi:predicted ATPase